VATIYIDNTPYDFEPNGRNILEVCLSLGFDLPYFCWHPAMHSVGACRQCAIKQFKDEQDTRGRIVMSCMTPAKDGMRISLNDPEAVQFRAGVIEWLMVNHPHDCPVCDEGGECHLQDMTVMTGHVHRRYRFDKRTYRNQYLGPFVSHEMNRCIQCYRCVRFYRDYAGGRDFDAFGCHDHVYFGRKDDGVLENPFSGNLTEVCPTGVFTDKTYDQHYARKWDLTQAPSICPHCSLGCNVLPGERYGTLRRVRNRFNHDVNGYFLCDRGRYGYEYVNSEQRVRYPLMRTADDGLQPAAMVALTVYLGAALQGRVVGIGSPSASLEANYALRALVGEDNFCHGLTAKDAALLQATLAILREAPVIASLRDVEEADAVLVLGEDLVNTAPRAALAVRQAAMQAPRAYAAAHGVERFDDAAIRSMTQDDYGPVYLAAPAATWLDDIATTYHAAPEEIARFGFAVAHALDAAAPPVSDISEDMQAFAQQAAEALKGAKKPLVIAGYGTGSLEVLHAAANVARALPGCRVYLTVPEANSLGVALLGGMPLEAIAGADTLVILENDLFRRLPNAAALLDGARHVIVLDDLRTATTDRAHAVLPAAAVYEADGTFVNNEGRAQRFFQVFTPPGEMQESWRWLGELRVAAGQVAVHPWPNLDDLLAEIAAALPSLAGIVDAAPGASFRLHEQKIPRQSFRFSGRTAITAQQTVFEPPPPPDPDSALTFSMEGSLRQPPAELVPRFWKPGWNSIQSLNKFQDEVGGPLRGGPTGVRLIAPEAATTYYDDVPTPFAPAPGTLRLLPAWHLFGSEPASLLAPGIAERAPLPYVALNPADAEAAGLADGMTAALTVGETTWQVAARLDPSLPAGIALLPAGLPDLRIPALPADGTVKGADDV
jgi:NADH-quinone oxidoreductase subunit G